MRMLMISAAAVLVGMTSAATANPADQACPPGGDNTNWSQIDGGGDATSDTLYYRGYSANTETDTAYTKGQFTTVTFNGTSGGTWQQPGNSPNPITCESGGALVCTVNGPANSQGEPESFTEYLASLGCTSVVYVN